MDEARLKKIEEQVNRQWSSINTEWQDFHHELIAALREAWRERNLLCEPNVEEIEQIRQRADRTEAELAGAKSQAMEWKRALDDVTSREWHQQQHEIEAELERLRAVREAAEALFGRNLLRALREPR